MYNNIVCVPSGVGLGHRRTAIAGDPFFWAANPKSDFPFVRVSMSMMSKSTKTIRLNVNIPQALHLALKQTAGLYGETLSDYLRRTLSQTHNSQAFSRRVTEIGALDNDGDTPAHQTTIKSG